MKGVVGYVKIVFLGTNGWYSTKTGLTPSVLVESEEMYIVLDAGEGFYKLDDLIMDEKKPVHLFISHFHLDHIIGLHTLNKFKFKQGLSIYGKKSLKKTLAIIVNHPFTVGFDALPFNIEVFELDEGIHYSPLKTSCRLLPHPDPSMGYRFEMEGKVLTYCTDTGFHENLHHLAKNSDVLILECAHAPGERRAEWPHLNPTEAAGIAKKAGAKKLFLTHFTANRYDTLDKRLEAEAIARSIFTETKAATDDLTYHF